MRKLFCAGALALATLGLLSQIPAACAGEADDNGAEQAQASTAINIGRIHRVLRLTPEQEVYWPPVEVALRRLARNQAHSEPAGFVSRISHRVISIVLDSASVERLAVAARPLVAKLNDDQKRAASGLAQEMGLGPVLAALN
jgi:hypothetical protein